MILIISGKAKQSITLYCGYDEYIIWEVRNLHKKCWYHEAQSSADVFTAGISLQMQINSVSFGNICVFFVIILPF